MYQAVTANQPAVLSPEVAFGSASPIVERTRS
jgi:hypothetical protein